MDQVTCVITHRSSVVVMAQHTVHAPSLLCRYLTFLLTRIEIQRKKSTASSELGKIRMVDFKGRWFALMTPP